MEGGEGAALKAGAESNSQSGPNAVTGAYQGGVGRVALPSNIDVGGVGGGAYDAGAEYDALIMALDEGGEHGKRQGGGWRKDAYQTLMSKERRVLETVDRVVAEREDRARARADPGLFGMTPPQFLAGMAAVIRGVLDELTVAKRPADVLRSFMRPDRQLYFGVLLVAVALLAACIA